MNKIFVSVVTVLACIYTVQSDAGQAPAKVIIGHAAMNARVAPLWVAEDQGFFQKYGVAASAIFIRQAPVLVAALTAGGVHAADTRGTSAPGAGAGGAGLENIIFANQRP